MADVAVLGTVAADFVVRVPTLPGPGDHLSAHFFGARLGGSSANVACGLALCGHAVELIGPVGDDEMAAALAAALDRNGVRTDRCVRVAAPAPRALILLDDTGERAIVQLGGPFDDAAFPVTDLPDLRGKDCVYVETYERFPVSAVERCPDALLVTTPPGAGRSSWPADVIVGSESQFADAWMDAPFDRARAVAGQRLQWVVVTHGRRGATAYGPDTSIGVPGQPARQVDATGAGDAFAAGLICGLLDGRGMRAAMELGAEQGAAAVEAFQSIPPGVGACTTFP